MLKSFMNHMLSSKNISVFKQITYIFLCLYVLDVITLGTNDILSVVGVSTRMIFWGISILTSIPVLAKEYKSFLKNKAFLMTLVFVVFVGISVVVGVLNGNYIPILIGDVKGFLHILIVIPMMCVLGDKEKLEKLLKLVLNVVVISCIISVFLSYMEMYPYAIKDFLYRVVNGTGIGLLTGITEYVSRCFLYSGTRMAAWGLLLAFAFLVIEKKKFVLRYIQMSCCLVGAFVSYARAVYLGMAIAVILFLVVIALRYREYLLQTVKKYVGVLLLTTVLISVIGITQHSNLFVVAIDRCIIAVKGDALLEGDEAGEPEVEIGNLEAEVDSLVVREIRQQMAIENFLKSPIVGGGLGVVNDPDNNTIEYFYLDLLSKMGLVGLIIFLLPAIICFVCILKKKELFSEKQKLLSLASWFGLLYLMIISYFNPCMNTSWGLMVYGMVITISTPWAIESNR